MQAICVITISNVACAMLSVYFIINKKLLTRHCILYMNTEGVTSKMVFYNRLS